MRSSPNPLTVVVLVSIFGSCGSLRPIEGQNARGSDLVDRACVLPGAPAVVREDGRVVLWVWRGPWKDAYARPSLPNDAGLLAYRAAIREEGAEERYPALAAPTGASGTNADVWRDERFNNDLAYRHVVGAIGPITCLDALLFAQQNARVPQLERPTEFLASVLRKGSGESEEIVVVFGAGAGLFPPKTVYGFDIVDHYLAQGWSYWYLLHNHTRQSNGALGIPVPSTSDVQFARGLAANRGLKRVRVTNGFYSFDAAIDEMRVLRAR
jgi:hypothetical protein